MWESINRHQTVWLKNAGQVWIASVILTTRDILLRRAIENMGLENEGSSKMQRWKMCEWTNRHQTAGLENARRASIDSQESY